MNALQLALAYLRQRPLATALNVLLLALGVATLAVLLLFGQQVERNLAAGAEGVDFVIGAKGSPLQLILSSVYHLDTPTGNIPLAEADSVAAHPAVASAIPLALGDSYRGVRIVGTDSSYVALYGGELAEGRLWAGPGEVVLGARVAAAEGLSVGDAVVSEHGVSEGAAEHGEPLAVVGVLAPGAAVLDGLILTAVETVWDVHGLSEEERAALPPGFEPPPPQLTALLIEGSSPAAVAIYPRYVNAETNLQAAVPAIELQRLLRLLGVGVATLRLFGIVLLAAAALGVFIALTNAMRERRYDLAVMRSLGASRAKLLALVFLEGLLLATLGLIAGLALGHGAVEALGRLALGDGTTLALTGWTWAPAEGLLVLVLLGVGLVASLLPGLLAYRTDVARTLATP
ncbi:MAG: FtsX-like permease family protein [Rubricoccaceae bacterium]|nr:FtsX-like permease family protein [Rubricoccaceae bacterium]